jgi:hypothetical protein
VLPRERGEVLDGHAVDPRSALVRLHALPRLGEVLTPLRSVRAGWLRILEYATIAALRALRLKDFLDHGSFLRGSMLLSVAALGFASCPSARGFLLAFLPRDGRPRPSWLQMVVCSFSCSGISTRDLNPIYNVPMLGTHKTLHPTAGKLPV